MSDSYAQAKDPRLMYFYRQTLGQTCEEKEAEGSHEGVPKVQSQGRVQEGPVRLRP